MASSADTPTYVNDTFQSTYPVAELAHAHT